MTMNLETLTSLHTQMTNFADELATELLRINILREKALRMAAEYDRMISNAVVETVKPQQPDLVEAVAEPAPKAEAKEAPVKVEAPKAETPKAKATPKPKAKSFVVPPGEKPTLKQALLIVMEDKVMGVDEALAELKKRGWAPNAGDPRAYLAHRMSQTKDLFERVRKTSTKKAMYRVRDGAEAPAIKTRKTSTKKAAKKATKKAAKKAPAKKATKKAPAAAAKKNNSKSDAEILGEFGINGDAVSPFNT
jgi:hypothetical protein